MVPRQLADPQVQGGEALGNVTRIIYLAHTYINSDIYLHWDNKSINVTNLPLILGLDFG